MNIIKRYLALGASVAMIAAAFSVGSISSAQTAPLMCTAASPSVLAGQTQTFTVTGGSGGAYTSTVQSGYTSTATNGNQITVVYPNPGTYTVTVVSNGTTANCFDVVNANTTTTTTGGTVVVTPLACVPATQNVNIGTSALFTASGGDGNYIWTGQNLVVTNATGSGFQVSYPSAGSRLITVSSAGQTASCTVNVVDPFPVIIPTFPNTGFGYGK